MHQEGSYMYAELLFESACTRSVIAEAPTCEADPEGDGLGGGCSHMSGQRIGALGPVLFPRRESSSQSGDQESGG
jgi:hypothetical protein